MQMHLTISEESKCFVNDGSPIDRYGPSLRVVTDSNVHPRLARRSSCYSRDTDGCSIYDYEGLGMRENDREKYFNNTITGDIQRPAEAHLSVNSIQYATLNDDLSKLIIQGLSDPYKSEISQVSGQYEMMEVNSPPGQIFSNSASNLKPIYPLRILTPNPRPQGPMLSPYKPNWETTGWPKTNPLIGRPSEPPIRPERWSAASPSLRTPNILVSPFKSPPSIVTENIAAKSALQLHKPSTKSNILYSNSSYTYPTKKEGTLVVIAVYLMMFCTAMDMVILSTSVPTITSHFSTIEDVGWYSTSYFLTACSAQLLFSKLYQFYASKRIYLVALVLFELGSLVSGAAPVSAMLIFGRALAGFGASGVWSGNIMIYGQCVPLGRKTVRIGILFGLPSVALVVGPLVGGVLTQYSSWRWFFFINIPFGVISCILMLASNWGSPSNETTRSTFQNKLPLLDVEGCLLFLPSIISLLLGLQWGGVKYPWGSACVIVAFTVFLVTISGFILIQRYKADIASIPPWIILNRNVYSGMLVSFCLGGSIALMVYYLPLWFQVTKDASPSHSGVMLLPLVLTTAITSMAIDSLVKLVRYYTPFLVFACVMMSIGGGLLTTLHESIPTSAWIGYQILFGLGAGSGIQQTLLHIRSSFQKPRDIAIATSLIIFAQTLGAAFAIGISQCVFENKLSNGIQAESLGAVGVQRLLHTGATELRKVLNGEDLDTVLRLYTNALDQVFYVSLGFAAVSILGTLMMECCSRGKRAPVVFN
ncbi:efflux pump antibiotic resistance protein, putative [Talaromyces stipitatus ATCC 10500]|uniref:Efflux pump antibiotic resistance protein, putative n=1 Tax=Talaromyces stipitatus (strain ATCC 10500 / CBS 375.48 / QM 6759 / NRRL 1006) TaxID=441959 RepID=B8MQ97_TALSN|nr:efflux pump antibiotic resistance protein, putative [Talaromyces stipitatus ATCC 10500]EED13244.1 efflux pump antibiotic resistance protein, putative [Talaromyces stipitatus ATCC 10500]